ncbi:hypothetical protein M199_gp033 [Halogranum tailed virus 1]|uniref:Uncharacterized protein n=1 Tax=Halogranum tailed virus 1 TaxID=1273749 RepID=R4TMF9_9CAUD|nr:hypothetical protein M199_gp033 [Halogranum tailed virus 1]AGM11363.1 hypothetical protein HGTV1_33 [Halogranum tailed virus 1]
MAQIATIRLQTQNSGIVDVPVFELSDVNYPVVRVQTASGVGALNLVDPVDAELDYLRVQTASGVKAVSNSIIQMLDSFEDGDISEYGGQTGSFTVTTGANGVSPPVGNYMLYSPETAPRTSIISRTDIGPSRGDHFGCYAYWQGDNNNDFWGGIAFANGSVGDNSNFSGNTIRHAGNTGSNRNELQIKEWDNGSETEIAVTSIDWGTWNNQWLFLDVTWANDDTITCDLRDGGPDGSIIVTVQGVINPDDPNGGMGFRQDHENNPYNTYFDGYQIFPQ